MPWFLSLFLFLSVIEHCDMHIVVIICVKNLLASTQFRDFENLFQSFHDQVWEEKILGARICIVLCTVYILSIVCVHDKR